MDAQEKDRSGWHREAVSNPNPSQHSSDTTQTQQRILRKWQHVLAAMLDGKPRNTIEHGRELGTTCLHSDVSGFEMRGLRFDRERVTVPGYGGSKASVVRYKLAPESFDHARSLLGVATPSSQSDGG